MDFAFPHRVYVEYVSAASSADLVVRLRSNGYWDVIKDRHGMPQARLTTVQKDNLLRARAEVIGGRWPGWLGSRMLRVVETREGQGG